MRKTLTLIAAMMSAMFWTGSAFAQEGTVYIPVDIIPCSYNEGMGPADLDAVIGKWNAYMDDSDSDTYAAYTMTKHYTGADQDFDFAWLGVHKSGTTMGAGQDRWMETGGALMAEFAAVADCPAASNFASRMFKAPPGGNIPQDGVILFSDCKVKDGVDFEELLTATAEWAKILGDAGSQAAMYHWYPAFGGGDEDFDFKSISSYPSYEEFGKDYDRMGNGGLFWQKQDMIDSMVDCDVERVYHAQSRRSAQIRD